MRFAFILSIVLLSSSVHAQNKYGSLFWNRTSLYNPASSGVNQRIYSAVTGQQQWLGTTDAPIKGTVLFDMKLSALNSGTGINFSFGKNGSIKRFDINLNYNYQFNLQNNRLLCVGLSGGIVRNKIDLSEVYIDPLEESGNKLTLFDFKLGVIYHSNHLDLGLSSIHYKPSGNSGNYTGTLNHYLLFGSYRFDLSEAIELQPNLLIELDNLNNINPGLRSGLLLIVKERLWTGITYALKNNIGATVGYDFKGKIRAGYAFEYIISSNNHAQQGNHEIMLALML